MASYKEKWVRRFFIAEVRRHKDGFTMYKVTSLIFLRKSPETASRISVWKRYNDFKKLYKSLEALNKHPSIKEPFPPFAKPHFFGRFEREVVNQRRKSAIKLLEFIAKHSVLYTSDAFVKFLESSLDFDDSSHSCDQSITSCDTSSEDDCDSNCSNSNTNKNDLNHQGITDILFNTKGVGDTIAERYNVKHPKVSSEMEKNNSIMLNFNVDSSQLGDNIRTGDENEVGMEESIISNGIPSLKPDTSDYIIVAAAHMSAGHQHKLLGEYEEAYIQYGFGITHLQLGAKIDPDPVRQAKVLDKIQKYIGRADKLYKKYLYHHSSALSKPATELENYKVLRVIGSVMLVKDTRLADTKRVIKTVEKCAGGEDKCHFVLRSKVPFMVDLHAYVQTESTIFLIIEYACRGLLWKFVKSHYGCKDIGGDSLCSDNSTLATCNNAFTESYLLSRDKLSPSYTQGKKLDLETNFVEISAELNDKSDACSNISTNQLMEQSQELLKSVDETLKKSNSMINNDVNALSRSYEVDTTLNSSSFHGIHDTKLSESSSGSKSTNHSDVKNVDTTRDSIYSAAWDTALTVRGTPETNESQEKILTKISIFSRHECSDDDMSNKDCKYWQIPEIIIKQWAAQLLLALEALHEQNVIISNLRPDDLLIDQNNNITLSYVVPRQTDELTNLQLPYAAPELFSYLPHMSADVAVDIWSFGVILYELLTGIPFEVRHPGLFQCHSIISIPHEITANAKHLLINVLKSNPNERLTINQIKQHPFFENIDWQKLTNP